MPETLTNPIPPKDKISFWKILSYVFFWEIYLLIWGFKKMPSKKAKIIYVVVIVGLFIISGIIDASNSPTNTTTQANATTVTASPTQDTSGKQQQVNDIKWLWWKINGITKPADDSYSQMSSDIQSASDGTYSGDMATLYNEIKDESDIQSNASTNIYNVTIPDSLSNTNASDAVQELSTAYKERADGLNDLGDYLNSNDLSKQRSAEQHFKNYQDWMTEAVAKLMSIGQNLGVTLN